MTTETFLRKEDWEALAKASERAKRGLLPQLSADQADRLTSRGYLGRSPRNPDQTVITASGKLAAQNWLKSTR